MIRKSAAGALALGLAGPVIWLTLSAEPEAPEVLVRGASRLTRGAPAPRVGFDAGPAQARPGTGSPEATQEPMLAAVGAPRAKGLTLEEGASAAGDYLACADRPSQVLELAQVMAGDEEIRPLLVAQAEAWRGSKEPAERARALLLLAALGELDADQWSAAVASEHDAEARGLMVEQAPLGLSPESDARLSASLLEAARFDADGGVRSAALGSLPALDRRGLAAVTTILREDADPEVRASAALYLRGVGSDDPSVVQGLLASARSSDEATQVRRAALVALLQIEELTPGTVEANGATREQLAQVIDETTAEQG